MIGRNQKNIIFLTIAMLTILACMPTLAPVSTPIPTFDSNSIYTVIVETANAAATQTQLFTTPTLTSTSTSTPTKTPSITPSPTNTFIFLIYSPTASKTPLPTQKPTTDYACTLIAQSPEDNATLGAGSFFSMRWQVKNTGTALWDANSVDYRYKSGAKIYQKSAYDLYKNIASGEVADIIVDMTAPTKPGKYQTVWVIRSGKKEFCKLTLTININ